MRAVQFLVGSMSALATACGGSGSAEPVVSTLSATDCSVAFDVVDVAVQAWTLSGNTGVPSLVELGGEFIERDQLDFLAERVVITESGDVAPSSACGGQ